MAVATDWRGRELRRLGDSFAGGTETYALSRLLGGCVGCCEVEMLDGGALRAEVGVLPDDVFGPDAVVGVLEREAVETWCCREDLPLAVEYLVLKVDGELERVEAGLAWPEVASLSLRVMRGRREVGEAGEVGDMGDIGEPTSCLDAP